MNGSSRHVGTRIGFFIAAALAVVVAVRSPAWAQAPGGDVDPPGIDCVTEVRGSLGANPATIHPRESTTLSWSVQVPTGCGALTFSIDFLGAGASGTRVVTPVASRSYGLRASFGGASRTIATTMVTVELVRNAIGQPTVTIEANHETPLLIQALTTPGAWVFVRNGLELDLTGYQDVRIAPGVQLIGGRTSREPGPLLYVRCTTIVPGICEESPVILFLIVADPLADMNVRITGIRLFGGEMDSAAQAAPKSFGIVVSSARNVDIDNNELYGWRGAAVRVEDPQGNICHEKDPDCAAPTARSVRVMRNYIHHNQHIGTEGYGVSISNGAYALIESNVFNHNRHAIMANGHPGTGYLAYRNLVLAQGGLHQDVGPFSISTHQFDVHGTKDCDEFLWIDGDLNCGDAGQYFDVRFNSFFYTSDNAFKLRGEPSIGVDVVSNVFAHTFLLGWQPALGGFVEFIAAEDNLLDTNEYGHFGHCDFDRDGVDDLFLATGRTWWFNSGGTHQWVYLATSRRRLPEVSLGDFDGDGRCDVLADGVISSGGTGRSTATAGHLYWATTLGTLAAWEMSGGTVTAQTTVGTLPPASQLAGTADLGGDGRPDLVWRDDTGALTLWQVADGAKVGEARTQAPGYTWQGSADFDADGGDDILWRDAAGQVVIWFDGTRTARVSTPVERDWLVRGVGDFDGDGRADILWQHTTGRLAIWHMAGSERIRESEPERLVPRGAAIAAVADFDGDGRADVLWRDPSGAPAIGFGGTPERVVEIAAGADALDAAAEVVDVRDYTRDGRADILWRDGTGRLVIWVLSGGRFERAEYPRQPLRGWTLALEERTAISRGGTDPATDDDLPIDCLKRCL